MMERLPYIMAHLINQIYKYPKKKFTDKQSNFCVANMRQALHGGHYSIEIEKVYSRHLLAKKYTFRKRD